MHGADQPTQRNICSKCDCSKVKATKRLQGITPVSPHHLGRESGNVALAGGGFPCKKLWLF